MALELAIKCDAVISYKSDPGDASDNWIRLEHPANVSHSRNASIILDGRLNIIQKTDLAWYSITYDPSQYEVDDLFAVQEDLKSENASAKKRKGKSDKSLQEVDHVSYNKLSWKIVLKITGTKTLINFETLPRWQDSNQSPKTYPLAQTHHQFEQLEIEIFSPATGKHRVENWHEARVLKLLRGQSWDPRFVLSDFLDAERTAIHAERLDELLDIGRMNRGTCKVETKVMGGSQVLLMIYPKNTLSADDWPSVLHQGSIINISSKTLFKEKRGLSRSRPDGSWSAEVDYDLGSAPICALLHQQIPLGMLETYRKGLDSTFAFTPQRLDITSQRGLIALGNFKDTIPNHDGNARGVMTKLQPDNLISSIHRLPISQVLLEHENQPVTIDDIQRNTKFAGLTHLPFGVDDEKRSAIENLFSHSISLIHGRPGSGKTLTLAAIAEVILREGTVKKILICTATNSVVDRIVQVLKEHMTSFKFAKIVSHKIADDELFNDTYGDSNCDSLHAHCMREIEADPDEFPDYIHGVEILKEKKSHLDDEQRRQFRDARDAIIRRFLQKTEIVVCTLASSCLPVLSDFNPDVLLVDDAPRAKTYEILMPLMQFGSTISRLVLTGDPKALGSKFTTERGAKQWKVSLLEKLLTRGSRDGTWPVTYLTETYRAHNNLHSPIKELFHKDEQIRCPANRSDPFMSSFVDSLPISIPGHKCQDLKLTTFTHFIDVPHPVTRIDRVGSSWSRVESEVIMNVVKNLLNSGICILSDILIETFYAGQVKELRSCAARHEVISHEKDKSLAISTVHSAQGLEANVVILSLTRGGARNLHNSMMNTKPVVNVAFSRARNVLIIVGDWKTASSSYGSSYEHNYLLPHEDRREKRGEILSNVLKMFERSNKDFVICNFQVDMSLADKADESKAREAASISRSGEWSSFDAEDAS